MRNQVKPTLYQLVPIAGSRDAVGKMVLGIQRFSKHLGYRSIVFTERQHNYFRNIKKGLLFDQPSWTGLSTPNLSVYHHSIGTHVADRFLSWPSKKKILIYHNITPHEFLPPNSQQAKDARWGRDQLPLLVTQSDLQIGLSEFSCEELRKNGARNIAQMPYYLRGNVNRKSRPSARKPTILIVGRVEPAKRVLEGVQAFKKLRESIPNARLLIVGQTKSNPDYVEQIRRFVSLANLENQVYITGRVSQFRLNRFYRRASVLLTLSDHEGFCVPLVEAMRAQVPVVAFNSGAIPETLGRGGVLLYYREPEIVAQALEKMINDPNESRAQEVEVNRFHPSVFEQGFTNKLASLIT